MSLRRINKVQIKRARKKVVPCHQVVPGVRLHTTRDASREENNYTELRAKNFCHLPLLRLSLRDLTSMCRFDSAVPLVPCIQSQYRRLSLKWKIMQC